MIFSIQFLLRLFYGLASRARIVWYKSLGVEIGGSVWIRGISIPRQWTDIQLQTGVALDAGVTLICSGVPTPRKLIVGARTYINRGTILDASESLIIGVDCMIGPFCYVTDHDHGIASGLSPASQPLISRATHVGDRVWLGAHVIILKGVTIGCDAVVAAGAVVTKDVPPGSRVAGVPARSLTYSQSNDDRNSSCHSSHTRVQSD